MAIDDSARTEILTAIDAALAGKWDDAHAVAQRHEGVPVADWLHAVLQRFHAQRTEAMPADRQPARPTSTYSTGVAPLSADAKTSG